MKRIRLPFVFLLFLGISLLASCRLRVRTLDEGQTGQALLQRGDTLYQGALQHGRYHGYGVLLVKDSVIYAGHWNHGRRQGPGLCTDAQGRQIAGTWNADTLVSGSREDAAGLYRGCFDREMRACGHGSLLAPDGSYSEGRWERDALNGHGFAFTPQHRLRVGEFRNGRFLGERLTYTTERIYGIDISKYQHLVGGRRYPIHWSQLRITHLGHASRKAIHGRVDYPISFLYIKSTEGTTLLNPFYRADYRAARAHGFRVGSYHFFSIHTPAAAQARHFLHHSYFRRGDLPPVLDVEPTPQQIHRIGGAAELFARVRTWLSIVRRQTGRRPVLYISQQFVNRYLPLAPDLKRNYDIWIARYSEYKPDVHLLYWQLCPDGRVRGIHGEVDISVFNGYQDVFDRFLQTL